MLRSLHVEPDSSHKDTTIKSGHQIAHLGQCCRHGIFEMCIRAHWPWAAGETASKEHHSTHCTLQQQACRILPVQAKPRPGHPSITLGFSLNRVQELWSSLFLLCLLFLKASVHTCKHLAGRLPHWQQLDAQQPGGQAPTPTPSAPSPSGAHSSCCCCCLLAAVTAAPWERCHRSGSTTRPAEAIGDCISRCLCLSCG